MRFAAVLVLALSLGCGIEENDPLPSIGAVCIPAEGRCGIEHVCRPDAPGAARGTCVPVASFGAGCDALDPVTHPPGREGTDDLETVELVINEPADAALVDDVRSFAGQLRTDRLDGAGALVELGNMCAFRDVQRVGDGLGIGKTDVVDLNGLQSLTSVAGLLAIYGNPRLTSLAGLENIVDLSPRTLEGVGGGSAGFEVAIVANAALEDGVIDVFVEALELRLGRPINGLLACNNDGEDCSGLELAIAQNLASTGLGLD